jgi:hypothetical protein
MSEENSVFIGTFGSNGGGKGVQGAQGISGAQGAQGVQGASGAQGVQGLLGVQGIQGLQGQSGSQGTQGIAGGLQGSQGVQGSYSPNGIYPLVLQNGSWIGNNLLISTFSSHTRFNQVDNFSISPHLFKNGFICDLVTMRINTGVASFAKLVIYNHNNTSGFPETLLYTSAPFSFTTTTIREIPISFTFQKNVVYWIGLIYDGLIATAPNVGGTVRGIFAFNLDPISLRPATGLYAQNVNYNSPPNPIVSSSMLFADSLNVRNFAFNFRIATNI